MDFGVNLLTRGITGNAGGLLAMAGHAEALGLGHVTANDHIVVPNRIASRYPYTPTGDWPGARAGERLEQVTALGFLAAATSRVRRVTSVMVVPHRPAVLAAKALATVDVLSRGRLTVGGGRRLAGRGVPRRGSPALRRARQRSPTSTWPRSMRSSRPAMPRASPDNYASFADLRFEPKPVQKPRPPIWVGGEGKVALRRVARHGDGWHPVGSICATRWTRPPAMPRSARCWTRRCRRPGASGRRRARLPVHWPLSAGRAEGPRRPAPRHTGQAAHVAADIAGFAAVGVGHFFRELPGAHLAREGWPT